MDAPSPDTALFLAESEDGPVGVIHLTTADDYYTNAQTAHIADVVVSPDAEGQGVGSALIAFAEQWARDRGFGMLTLNVFVKNGKARQLYVRLGFGEEWLRCIKRL
jgi:GNAT superfamily N-acetyltransferase